MKIHPYKDILDQTITGVHFAKCPLRGWFLDHWALVIERADQKFMTLQFLTDGLEIQRLSSLDYARLVVARSSNAQTDLV